MSRFKSYFPALALLFFCLACSYSRRPNTFTRHKAGYYYQLLAFSSDSTSYQPGRVAWLSATFRNQNDSVFWDSENNLQDAFYVSLDTFYTENAIKHFVSRSSELDSACLLIRSTDFFRQQFHFDALPFFSKNDSVVKVNLKVKAFLNLSDYLLIRSNLREKEEQAIEQFFGSTAAMEGAADPLGFYWIDRPRGQETETVHTGDQVNLRYEAYYLNGRFLEKSPDNFEIVYGTPDQLLKGLNYAISRLKMGDNAKIIVPSSLAFGKEGSSNGIVPPYTPLIYQIRINNVKKEHTF